MEAYLRYKCGYPDNNKYNVPLEPIKHITLPMDFTSIYFIEQRHHHKCVEDHGKVLRWGRSER